MNKKFSLKGKRFLIAQPMICSFCGSTMVTLELAKYLSSVGAKVVVYTNIALSPAFTSFDESGIKVISSKDDYSFSLGDFDYVWIHSLTIPRQLLDELKHLRKKMPAFIFLHMSCFDHIPDEHPWIYDFENKLSSLSLYISEETLESNKKFGLPSKVGFFRNPAPLEFQELAERKVSRTIRKVLIVSNHPPKEILDAREILVDDGVKVDVYGEGRDNYSPISAEALKKYDAVITIGKTVQYCIVGLLPVYIYDWFGGPGWLSKTNYELAKQHNFSGRPFSQKTGEEIAREILDGFAEALDFHLSDLSKNIDEFKIDYVMEKVMREIKPIKIKPLKEEYIESAKAAVYCAEIRFISSEELGVAYKYNDELKRKSEEYEKTIDNYKSKIEVLSSYKKMYQDLAGSKRMRFLDTILKPHDKLKGYLKKEK